MFGFVLLLYQEKVGFIRKFFTRKAETGETAARH